MYCLKCGRDTESSQIFCDRCLQVMAENPVKPGTAILLPHQMTQEPSKKQPRRRRPMTPEEQICHLSRTVRRLGFLVAVVSLLLCLVAGMLVHTLLQRPVTPGEMGRNYTAVAPSDAP